ncbi:sugar phosphate isomerase/epimerase family protein [Alicyclobacillus fastidiosus]|uniref:Sugar phosphate isomerase/epimerase family protein n=1 Tax=Alicyclobacillus fastidiosus TaxID=392011 RepID=A0ABV5AEA6_9BACL|nr:sugar phosphate isomerase/epimerase family protein [Alicyclobacillus fastidiosus]WEH09823.1 sugar phosphate isomerase/epimerase [Alicyclobacillus fastidiosus]
MKLAVNQWCFPEGTPLREVFKQSELARFDGVELNLNGVGGVGLTLDTAESEIRAIKRQADDHHLALKSVSTGLLWQSPLSSSDADTRRGGRDIVRKQLEVAALLEAETILVVPGCVTNEVPYEECYRRSQEELADLAIYAGQLGVQIGIENVWNKFLLSPMEMARYVDELQSEWVGVYFDVGNVLQFGFPEQWIRYLGRRIQKVHVKDFSTNVGNIHGFVPLLAGDVDWHAVRQALLEIGYDGYVTAELTPYACHSTQLPADTARQMAKIFADH